MTIEWHYPAALKEIQETFCSNLEYSVVNHFNWIITKYGAWNRYPRKIKKFLKRNSWWVIKDMSLINVEDVKIRIKNFKGEECKLNLDFPESFLDNIRDEICEAINMPKEMLKK